MPTPYGVVTASTAGLRGSSSVDVVVTGAASVDSDVATLTKGILLLVTHTRHVSLCAYLTFYICDLHLQV
jgi:hypothetical protein